MFSSEQSANYNLAKYHDRLSKAKRIQLRVVTTLYLANQQWFSSTVTTALWNCLFWFVGAKLTCSS